MLLISMASCTVFNLEGESRPLPTDLVVTNVKRGYSYALKEAEIWSANPALESVTAIYRRTSEDWKLVSAYYVFLDSDRKKYFGLTLDLRAQQLRYGASGDIAEKRGITTSTVFELHSNPIDEQGALLRAEDFLQSNVKGCSPNEVVISGNGGVRQVWWVNFKNPKSSSPLFLPTIYVDAITGDIQSSPVAINC